MKEYLCVRSLFRSLQGRSVGFAARRGASVRALQGVVVAIFGLAELVQEKDDSLKAED